jgi:hypothetical protein
MHPAVVRYIGGKAKTVAAVKRIADEMAADGFDLASAECGEPSEFTEANGRMYVVVPTPSMMETAKQERFAFMAYLLGVSADGGRTWRFIAWGDKDLTREKIKMLIPDLPDGLTLPAPTRPILIERDDK